MKARTGSLVKRASGYYIRIVVEGKIIVRVLRNPDGTPCRTLTEARRAQADFIRPFALADKAEALQGIQRRIADVQAEAVAKPTVVDCWRAYLASPDRLPSGPHTQREYTRYARDFAQWIQDTHPNTVYVQDVSKAIACAYAATLADRYSGVTFNKRIAFLKAMFRALLDSQDTPFNKCKPKPIDSTPHKPLSQEQIQAVLNSTTGELNTLLLIGVYTGLRLGDASNLRWEQVDLERNIITVTPSKTSKRSGKTVVIPIHPTLRARLETTFRTSDRVCPYIAWRYQSDRSAVTKKLHRAFEGAGIATKDSNGHTVRSYHSLRFSIGQQLVSAGFSLDCIAQVLGHSNQTMTRHYSTITDTVREQAILSLPSIATA